MDEIKELIENNEYELALRKLLEQEEQYLLKTQCLYELKQYEQLITFFNDVEDKIEDDYFEIFGYYILSLLEIKEFDRAIAALSEELAMPYIQDNYEEVLNILYDDVLAQKQAYLIETGVINTKLSEENLVAILKEETNYDELVNAIMKLEDFNIRKFLDVLEDFLTADRSPVLKSFVLEIMIKQQISETILVTKNDVEYEFMPVANQLVFQDVNYIKCRNLLEEHLAKQPSYLEMCLELLDLVAYIIYPTLIDIDEVTYLAGLIEYYVFSVNSDELETDFESYYQQDKTKVIDNVNWLIDILKTEERYSSGEYDNS